MAHFELGGCVSVDQSQSFQSSFARELVKESSICCNDSVYKSSFATELLESSHNNSVSKVSEQDGEENIYENVNPPITMEDSNPFLDDSTDFRRCSQIYNSTMVGTILCSSPRESMSSISRVQTVLSIDSSLGEIERPVTDNFNRLQGELKLLQAKLNDMEKSRITYEATNQQLLSLVNKLSSQLSRNVKISQDKTISETGTEQTKQNKTESDTPNPGLSSSFRRQKGIRMKKRDSVKRRVSVRGDAASYTSSDSGNYSDIDETNTLHRLLRKGLHLVTNVNQELESKVRDKHLENNETLKSSMSSSISRVKNSKKIVIKINNGEEMGERVEEEEGEDEENRDQREELRGRSRVAQAHCQGEIHRNGSGSVLVPVPFYV